MSVDFLEAYPGSKTEADVMVVMTHGLESRSDAPLCIRMARAFQRRGFDVATISFRSCAGDNDIPSTPGGYHLGFTHDVRFVVKKLHQRYPDKRLYLSAFSLGGNVMLKYLGEEGEAALLGNGVCGAAVTCVPMKPEFCEPLLGSGFNRVVYSGNFLKSLKPKAVRQMGKLGEDAFPPRYNLEAVLSSESIGDFDEAFIAPIYGFEDKYDYYRTQGSASGGFLQRIKVPTMVLNARDDPFIDEATLPTEAEVDGAPVKLVYTQHGGHCGFIGARAPVVDYAVNEEAEVLAPGRLDWLMEELARFVQHADVKFGAGAAAAASTTASAVTKAPPLSPKNSEEEGGLENREGEGESSTEAVAVAMAVGRGS